MPVAVERVERPGGVLPELQREPAGPQPRRSGKSFGGRDIPVLKISGDVAQDEG
ncbi:hypothetical protein GCM10023108_26040 [Saccharopolyspora hordei]|uniref:Uncharacterized protein n=1 Tax=Saccharopolyspora hordei TaxID=1838 RepID=A0A853AP20_9PSEU|nr:hypothetical protein [Saccharopolyspora hordei]